ncbi:MAG: hypothetical protein AAF720_15515 [Pseudomonadota bacterium]
MVFLDRQQKSFDKENGYLAPVRIMTTGEAARFQMLYEQTFADLTNIPANASWKQDRDVDLSKFSPHP